MHYNVNRKQPRKKRTKRDNLEQLSQMRLFEKDLPIEMMLKIMIKKQESEEEKG